MKTRIPSALIVITFLFVGLLPQVQAVSPTPDGCYPNFTTAEGCDALSFLTTGAGNTGLGWRSLFLDSTGSFNTAIGGGALALNNADSNTAVGATALLLNTTGTENTAVGTDALVFNEIGNVNSAFGAFALFNNTGNNNTAIGDRALLLNTSGGFNTAVGQAAMLNNTTGSSNIAIGVQALGNNDTGSSNIAIGNVAGTGVTIATDVICIGNVGGADVDSRTYIANIYPNVQPIVGTDPDSVTITSAGKLGRGNVSSRRYKHDIQPMDKASEAIYALEPVTFRYNKQYDATQTLAFGLIAEEVAEVYPDLVGRNPQGQPESVRYEQINAMLLNEFLREHRKVQQQDAVIAELKKQIETIVAHSKQQDANIQRVSARIELNRLAARTVVAESP